MAHNALREIEGLIEQAQQLESQIKKAQQEMNGYRAQAEKIQADISSSFQQLRTDIRELGEAQQRGIDARLEIEAISSRLIEQEREAEQIIRATNKQPHWLTITKTASNWLPTVQRSNDEFEQLFREASIRIRSESTARPAAASPLFQPQYWQELAQSVPLFEEAVEKIETEKMALQSSNNQHTCPAKSGTSKPTHLPSEVGNQPTNSPAHLNKEKFNVVI